MEWLIPDTIQKELVKSNAIHGNQDGIKGNVFYFKKAILIVFEVLHFLEKKKKINTIDVVSMNFSRAFGTKQRFD